MSSCPSCGHQLGLGRYCSGCGAPVGPATGRAGFGSDWRTDTAERKPVAARAADPRTPPAAVAPPPPPRYPLYADEVEGYSPAGPLRTRPDGPGAPPAPLAAVTPPDHDDRHTRDHVAVVDHEPGTDPEERRSPVLWLTVAALVLALVAATWWFLVRDNGADSATGGRAGSPADPAATGEAPRADLAARASAAAPSTAPPHQDVNGDQVSYDASNMLDHVPATAWRTEGDATGTELTFTLPGPTELVAVGMVNGYAKRSTDPEGRTFDWYRGHRRVKAVVWVFDDGTRVRQQLVEDPRLQLIDLPGPVTTTTVVARLVRVSAPGAGRAARDFTAVSEVSLVGPAGP